MQCWKTPLDRPLKFQDSNPASLHVSLFFTPGAHTSTDEIPLDLSCFPDPSKLIILAQEVSGTGSCNASKKKKKKTPNTKTKKQERNPSLDICSDAEPRAGSAWCEHGRAAADRSQGVCSASANDLGFLLRDALPDSSLGSAPRGLGWGGQSFSAACLSLRGLSPAQQCPIVSIFHRGPFKTKGKEQQAPWEVLDKGKSLQSPWRRRWRTPRPRPLGRMQASFNILLVRSPRKTLPCPEWGPEIQPLLWEAWPGVFHSSLPQRVINGR